MLPILIAAIAFVIGMIGVALVAEHLKKMSKTNLLKSTIFNKNIINEYFLLSNDLEKFKTNTFNPEYYMGQMFSDSVIEKYNPELTNAECSLSAHDTTSCTYVYKFKNGSMLTFTTYQNPLRGREGNVLYSGAIPLEAEKILLIHNWSLVSPIKDNDAFYNELVALSEECQINRVREQENITEGRLSYYSVAVTSNGIELQPHYRKLGKLSTKRLDSSYNGIDIEYLDHKVQVPMSKGVRLIDAVLANGENVYVFGGYGTGKSTLLDIVASQTSSFIPVFINAISLKGLTSFDVYSSLQTAVSNVTQDGTQLVFFIDEAEHLLKKTEDGIHLPETSFFLSMLSGHIKQELNCACALTFNCSPDKLNPAAFRDGRKGLMINLDLMDKATKGVEFVNIMKLENPTHTFDTNKFNQLPEQVTLAQLYALFSPPSKHAVIMKIIGEITGKPLAPLAPPRIPKPPTVPEPLKPEVIPGPSNSQQRHKGKKNKKNKYYGAKT